MEFVKNRLIGFAEIIGFSTIVCIIAGMLGKISFVLDVCSHFRLQGCVALLICGVILIALAKRKWLGCVVMTFGIYLLVTIAPFWLGGGDVKDNGANTLTVVSFNVLTSNPEKQAVANYLLTLDADVIVVAEIDDEWQQSLDTNLSATYPHRLARTRVDNFGIGVYSKIAFAKNSAIREVGEYVPTLDLFLELSETNKIRLIGTHPLPPTNTNYWLSRNEQLAAIAEDVRIGAKLPTIVCGDLNTSPWSPFMQAFVERSGLDYASKGFGLKPTWDLFGPVLGLPIDHILIDAERIRVHDYRVGPPLGSDHRPVVAELSIGKLVIDELPRP